MTENVLGFNVPVTFDYDAIYRLTLEKRITDNPMGSPMWYEYIYDDAGNRRTLIQKNQTGMQIDSKGYAHDDANRLTLEGDLSMPGMAGNIQYTWDNNGNLRTKTVLPSSNTFYSYDRENHMTRFNDTVTLDFKYDGDGARREKSQGASVTKFIYGSPRVVLETDSSGATIANYTHGLGLVTQKRSGITSYFHLDANGSSRQLTNTMQSVTDTYTYDAWGNLLSSGGTTVNGFQFETDWGRYSDSSTGLVSLSDLYYDPRIGRFLSAAVDPYGFAPQESIMKWGGSAFTGKPPSTNLSPACTQLRDQNKKDRKNCGGDKGATPCDPDKGNLDCFVCATTCIRECIEEHELGHANVEGRICCKRLAECITQARKDPKKEEECCHSWRSWASEEAYNYEVRRAPADVECLTNLSTRLGCEETMASVGEGPNGFPRKCPHSLCCQQIKAAIAYKGFTAGGTPRPATPCPPGSEWPHKPKSTIAPGPDPKGCTQLGRLIHDVPPKK